ncbi:DUF3617 domain-containing protein [Parasphingorhabdus halotolerans]|uniref:Protease inhibitor Inh n=1 Tax=Parasphingorhabdus halotolerans TaxID=2725558 RepID=A0A6H2DJG4_9SPHN|nr:hypothetical protein [Parasphingorhabdus halotolerans]QJB68474.1 hypothetical protein HF685_03465 [Parasphingorhabdus halotolerans]
MKFLNLIKTAGLSSVAFFAFTVAAPAQAPDLALLDGLQKGSWTLKERGASDSSKRICLGDAKLLLQVQHGSAKCTRYVIEDKPNVLRVSYKCGNLGHGVTEIRRESSGLIQLNSQGISSGSPFSFSAEGRRTGAC